MGCADCRGGAAGEIEGVVWRHECAAACSAQGEQKRGFEHLHIPYMFLTWATFQRDTSPLKDVAPLTVAEWKEGARRWG